MSTYEDPFLRPASRVGSPVPRDLYWDEMPKYNAQERLDLANAQIEQRRNAEAAQEAVGARLAQISLAGEVAVAPPVSTETTDSHPEA